MSRGALIEELLDDLVAERNELVWLLSGSPEEVWTRPTPAVGWTVHDQIAHLAHFDDVTRLAITDRAAFIAFRDGLDDLQAYVDSVGETYRDLGPAEMIAWWTAANDGLVAAAREADPGVRVEWFGPAMGLASKITARLMETWAHGQDVYDAIGADRVPSERLRHIARLGVATFANSFRTRDLEVPTADVRVELLGPDGTVWAWGPESATDRVEGTALDFGLVVTQRRHVDDTDLEVSGGTAAAWMSVAQAFAGPPGPGRPRVDAGFRGRSASAGDQE